MLGPRNVKREGLEVVYRASGLLRAQVIKGRLEASGIPAVLDYESLGPTLGVTVDGLGEVRVLVPVDRAGEARELIASEEEDDDVLDIDDEPEWET
jgi:hypothetical protein